MPVTGTAGFDALVTVTQQVAENPPSAVATVMYAVPAAVAVTKPLLTVATPELEELHVTDWFVALAGVTVAVSSAVAPAVKVRLVLSSDTPVTETVGFDALVTVTWQEAENPPSAVATVIYAEPAAVAVTNPLLTVATPALEELHVTDWFVALAGVTVAVNSAVSPVFKVRLVLSSDTPVTETVGFALVTVTWQEAIKALLSVTTVMAAAPAPVAVTKPLLSTVTTLKSEELHQTARLVALAGITVAVSCAVSPVFSVRLVLSSDTPVTGITELSATMTNVLLAVPL
jgi:hypothetical protein